MASDVPTPLSFPQKLRLLWLAVFDPERFEAEEAADNKRLNDSVERKETSRIRGVRRGFGEALLWCLASLLLGAIVGTTIVGIVGPSPKIATAVIVAGTVVLLWATLAVRGWDLQSIRGVTLSERVNRWAYRALYAIGTFLIVLGSVWAAA